MMSPLLNRLESIILDDLKSDSVPECIHRLENDRLLHFGIWAIIKIGLKIRQQRLFPINHDPKHKHDGSPFTKLEQDIEKSLREWLNIRFPEAALVGEETGGLVLDQGTTFVIDPIDGTYSFLTLTETCATTIGILKDKRPSIGLVMNPATGELGYGTNDGKSRLLQLSSLNDESIGIDLPVEPESDTILVNLHASKSLNNSVDSLVDAWKRNDIQLVRSMAGSPAWGILEACKGFSIYVNAWQRKPASIYDLTAPALIIRSAGGDIVDERGNSINESNHQGLFVAGINHESIQKVLNLL